jgi:cell shape-determining protein MreC
MKYLFFIFIVGMYGCQNITAQSKDKTLEKDAYFEKLMKQVKENDQLTFKISADATNEQKQIVEETVNKIVALKEENKELKEELNETKAKLDSASIDTLIPFVISPISSKKDF